MYIIQGFKKNIVKATIDKNDFIRVTNLDENNSLINVVIYVKKNDKYKVVKPMDIPYSIVNKLSIDNTYKIMNDKEIDEFLNSIKGTNKLIKEQNKFIPLEYLLINTVVDVNYMLAKEANLDYFTLNSLLVDEEGVIQYQDIITPTELPYILIDIIEKEKDFNYKTFLISQNIFAHVYKDRDKYLTILYEYKDSQVENEPSIVEDLGKFILVKSKDNYTIVFDVGHELFSNINKEKLEEISNEFLKTIKLSKEEYNF